MYVRRRIGIYGGAELLMTSKRSSKFRLTRLCSCAAHHAHLHLTRETWCGKIA